MRKTTLAVALAALIGTAQAYEKQKPAPPPDPAGPTSEAVGVNGQQQGQVAAGTCTGTGTGTGTGTAQAGAAASGSGTGTGGQSGGNEFGVHTSTDFDSLALDIPGMVGAQFVRDCHESNGGRGVSFIGTGGRTRINEVCLCTATAVRVMSPPISRFEEGLAMLNQCKLYAADVEPAAPPAPAEAEAEEGVVVFDMTTLDLVPRQRLDECEERAERANAAFESSCGKDSIE